MRDPQTVPAVTFDHFWLFFFFSWVGYSFFLSFFLSFFFLGWLFVVFFVFLFLFPGLVVRCFFFFFFFLGWLFVVVFFFFFTVRSSILVFFFNFLLASMSLGTEKKKSYTVDRYGPTNSVKNIEWWKLGDDAKRVWKFEWWVMSDEWWKLSDQKNEAKQPLNLK